jgi:protein-S-isoprenylcysteine O-methyltransferase Ste14
MSNLHSIQTRSAKPTLGQWIKRFIQIIVMTIYTIMLVGMLIVAALDAGRFRWSEMPMILQALGVIGVLFIIRTALEDRMLQDELPGYKEYAQRVRYRLVPGIW